MSFFHIKMSQNLWATIMSFGPVTLIFYWPNKFFWGQPKSDPHFKHCWPQKISGTDFVPGKSNKMLCVLVT